MHPNDTPAELTQERLKYHIAAINDKEICMYLLHHMHTKNYPYKSVDTSMPVYDD